MEVWKDIIGYEDRFQVSDLGNVRSKNYYRKGYPQLVKLHSDKKGYLRTTLLNKARTVHRLVATHFIPNPDNKPQINHINGNKEDNRLVNLEWCTGEENMKHAFETGLKRKKKPRVYKGYPTGKPIVYRSPNGDIVCNNIYDAANKSGYGKWVIYKHIKGLRKKPIFNWMVQKEKI